MSWLNTFNTIKKIKRLQLLSIGHTCFILLMFSACNTSTKESKSIIEDATKTVKNVQKAEDFRERLEAMNPATEAELKNWLPHKIGDFKRTEFGNSHAPQNEIASAEGIYKDDTTDQKISIKIVDGASKSGLIAINSHYMAQNLKIENVKKSGHEKTYEHNGLKVLETYVQKSSFYRISFLYDMRFGITIETYHLSHEELWQVITSLNLKQLKQL